MKQVAMLLPSKTIPSPTDTAFARAIGEHCELLRQLGIEFPSNRLHIGMPNQPARCLEQALRHFIPQLTWLDEYNEVADWLSDNHGKGLMLMGPCGRGKTEIALHALPCLLHLTHNLVLQTFTACEMSEQLEKVVKLRLVAVDDIGTEAPDRVDYGNRRCPFAELVDTAEKRGNLLVLTTNLPPAILRKRYGDRVYDRLRTLVRVVQFDEGSLRT